MTITNTQTQLSVHLQKDLGLHDLPAATKPEGLESILATLTGKLNAVIASIRPPAVRCETCAQ